MPTGKKIEKRKKKTYIGKIVSIEHIPQIKIDLNDFRSALEKEYPVGSEKYLEIQDRLI